MSIGGYKLFPGPQIAFAHSTGKMVSIRPPMYGLLPTLRKISSHIHRVNNTEGGPEPTPTGEYATP